MKTTTRSKIAAPPPPKSSKPAGRLPQRSEAIAGDETKGDITPIAAAQPKAPQPK